jgi:dipeptidyl-peptidase 4
VRICLWLALAPTLFAQKKPITLEALGDLTRAAFNRTTPGTAYWAPDGKTFAFRQGTDLRLYLAAAKQSKAIVSLQALDAAALDPPEDGPAEWTDRRAHTGGIAWSADGQSLLYTSGGDIFLIHVATATWEQLTKTAVPEIDPKLSPDGKKVLFRRGSDLYTVDVDTRKETRLTSGGASTLLNGGLDWVYPEEIGLSTAFWWSHDSKWVAYLQFDTSREPLFPHEDLLHLRAVFEPERYPQAGENNADVRLGVVAAGGGPTRWYDVGDTRNSCLIARAGWMPDGQRLYVVRTNRVQNQLEAFTIDRTTGATTSLFRESDPFWINLKGDLLFLRDGRFLWTSERTGYRHIYLYSNDGKEGKALTHGSWEVTAVDAVDETSGRVFYSSSEPSPLEQHLYSVDFTGRDAQRISWESGTHNVSMGPGGSYYLDTFSSLVSPPVTTLHTADGRETAVYRAANTQESEYQVLPAEIVHFRGADGTELAGRLIKPAAFEAGKKYPVVVNVYGGPDVALPVRNAWPGVGLDQVLAQRGYVVWQADNRGGAGRGHAFETVIAHQLGINELADQIAGVRYLISLGFADPARIGIRGWSYGGFMTVNALLRAPDLFRAGFAGAPVTDWLNYDTIYTERYMGLPQDNQLAYEETALTRDAAKLRGKLLLVHNFEDDNVLFQNTLQLVNALQQAGKQFEFMLYPQKAHNVGGKAATQMNELALEFFDRSLK